MRKIMKTLLILLLGLSMAACSNTPTPDPSPTPTPEPTPSEDDGPSGSKASDYYGTYMLVDVAGSKLDTYGEYVRRSTRAKMRAEGTAGEFHVGDSTYLLSGGAEYPLTVVIDGNKAGLVAEGDNKRNVDNVFGADATMEFEYDTIKVCTPNEEYIFRYQYTSPDYNEKQHYGKYQIVLASEYGEDKTFEDASKFWGDVWDEERYWIEFGETSKIRFAEINNGEETEITVDYQGGYISYTNTVTGETDYIAADFSGGGAVILFTRNYITRFVK